MENPFPKGKEDSKSLYKSRVKCWAFTVYNLPSTGQSWIAWMRRLLAEDQIRCFLWSVEICPSTGTEHSHAGIWFTSQVRYNELKKMMADEGLKAWKSPMKNWQKYQDYAEKDQNSGIETQFQPQFLLEGTLPERLGTASENPPLGGDQLRATNKRGRRARLTEEQAHMVLTGQAATLVPTLTAQEAVELGPLLREAAQMTPPRKTPPTVLWFYGDSGSAKSALAQWIPESKSCSVAYVNLNKESRFWQGYLAQEVLVLDEARSEALTFELFLKLANWTPLTVEVKNSSVSVRSHLIIITSPRPPWDFWEDAVDQRGHEKDLWQAMRRISLVLKFFPTGPRPPPVVQAFLLPIWTKAPLSLNVPSVLSPDERDLAEASSVQNQSLTEFSEWLDERFPTSWSFCAEGEVAGFRKSVLTNRTQKVAIVITQSHVITFSPKLKREDQANWTSSVPLPVNMQPELEEELLQELEKETEMKICTAAVWEYHESNITRIMLEHYVPEFRMPTYL